MSELNTSDSTAGFAVPRERMLGLNESPAGTSKDNFDGRSNEFDTDRDSSCADEIIMCVFYRKSKLAAAVYFVETSEMHLMYDVTDLAPDYRLLSALFLQVKPSQIVTCPSLPDFFIRKVHSLITGEEVPITPSADPPAFVNKFHFIPTKEFRYTSCKRCILEMRLPNEPENATESDRHSYIMSVINLNAQGLVSAVGGLLYFLQRSQARLILSTIQSPVLAINTLSLKNLMWVDEETMNALHIFAPLAHPSSYKWAHGASKEGLSVFSLLNRCYSTSGSKYMRVLLSQPTRDKDILQSRHEVISFCLKPVNEQVVKSITDSVVHVKSVMKILTQMTNAQASIAQWKAFYNTIYNAVLVGEVCKAYANEVKFFQQIADCLCDSIYITSHCINRIMDFEESAHQNRVIVKFGICDDLDRLKERQTNHSTVMARVAEQELQQLPDYVESCSLAYIPEIGYLLALPHWDSDLTDEQLNSLPGLLYKSKTKDLVYYKSARCVELDYLLGDVQLKVIEIESKIVLKLVQYIQRNVTPLVQLTSLIAELDCLLALTQAARDYNLVKPTLATEKQIHITKGRYILQELCVNVFVPNDTHSSQEHGYIKILSGPNASGKSVYLKQVALIVYLAHIGSFVPAESATISIMDQIHSRIQTVESVSTQLSAFMTDLRQMSLSIRNSTTNSLVIVDEFGKGTSEVDGLGILAACLEHFIDRKDTCPHIFVSNNFHSLSKLLPLSPAVKLQHLEHMVDKGELIYLYKLKDGAIESSFALQIAQSKGLSQAEATRADQILNNLKDLQNIAADSGNRQSQLAARRRLFLKKLSREKLDGGRLSILKKELLTLHL